ncbi:MAG: trigger factor [Clostridia bacterium]|nr:trigger factor [Clostridia bacterium]
MSIKQEKTKNKNELKLTFTVEAEKFDEAIMNVFKKSAKYFNIPGFRKGKAPFKIVEKYYGDDIFYEDAFNDLVPEIYDKEIKDNKIDAVSKPEIDVVQMEKGKDLIFTAIVATKPDFKLGKYKGVELKKIEYKVTDEDIEHELGHMAEHNSRMVSVDDRAVKDGDQVVIDFEGFVDGKAFEGGKAEGQQLTIGSKTFIPGFEEQLIGMKLEEEKDIKVTFPEDYFSKDLAGKEATFHIKLHSISVKELPKIDDEFAKDVSEFDTLKELKASIKEKKKEENEHRAKHEMEDAALEAVCENTTIDIPEGMIELEIDNMEDNIGQRLQYQGMSLDQYLKMMGKTEKELREEFKEDAKKNVKTSLVLEKIVEEEKFEADKDYIKEELEKMAKQYNRKVEELEKNDNLKEYLETASKNEQAVKIIIDNAKLTK